MEKDYKELEKENQGLKSLVDAYKETGEEMRRGITALKHQLGGYKTQNANYKKKVAALELQLETKILEVKDWEKQCTTHQQNIDKLLEKVSALRLEVSNLNGKLKLKENEIRTLNEDIEELSTPWWKRIF